MIRSCPNIHPEGKRFSFSQRHFSFWTHLGVCENWMKNKVISSDSERDWRIHNATSTVTEIRAALEVEVFVVMEHALASVVVILVALFLVSLERILPLTSRNFPVQFVPYLKDWHCYCYMPQLLRDQLLIQHLKNKKKN